MAIEGEVRMLILGVDAGLAAMGLALVDVGRDKETVLELDVLRTRKSAKKRNLFASEDNVRRALELADGLSNIAMSLAASGESAIDAICCESMSHPRSSSSAGKMALAWGVIIAFAHKWGVPIIQASPQRIKNDLCGNRAASKEEVQAALCRVYDIPEGCSVWQLPATQHNHAFDALAAAVICCASDAISLARKL